MSKKKPRKRKQVKRSYPLEVGKGYTIRATGKNDLPVTASPENIDAALKRIAGMRGRV